MQGARNGNSETPRRQTKPQEYIPRVFKRGVHKYMNEKSGICYGTLSRAGESVRIAASPKCSENSTDWFLKNVSNCTNDVAVPTEVNIGQADKAVKFGHRRSLWEISPDLVLCITGLGASLVALCIVDSNVDTYYVRRQWLTEANMLPVFFSVGILYTVVKQ